MRPQALLASSCLLLLAVGCGEAPAPKSEPSSKPTTPIASASVSASAAPVASTSAVAPAPSAAPAPAASASAAASAPLVPAEKPAPMRPGEGEFAALDKEIAVKASSEQKCSTKVLSGWFEMICPEAEGLVRATQVDVESGFDKDSVLLEMGDGKWMRFTAQLPASGEPSRARFWGKGLHEIFLTLEHGDKGWKGGLTGKRPTP